MNLEQQLLLHDKNYIIFSIEQENIIHPAALGIVQLNADTTGLAFACSFEIVNYHIILKSLTLYNSGNRGIPATITEALGVTYEFMDKTVAYSGAILIVDNPVKDFFAKGYNSMCFAYRNVYELIFEDGNLITTIDHGRAMTRIRKNIELGLRSMTNKRDVRCITHFMNTTFMGNYKPFSSSKKRLRYLEEMEQNNQGKCDELINQFTCNENCLSKPNY
jgi:hypothetical protein